MGEVSVVAMVIQSGGDVVRFSNREATQLASDGVTKDRNRGEGRDERWDKVE